MHDQEIDKLKGFTMLLKISSKRRSAFGYRIIKSIKYDIIINLNKYPIKRLPIERKNQG